MLELGYIIMPEVSVCVCTHVQGKPENRQVFCSNILHTASYGTQFQHMADSLIVTATYCLPVVEAKWHCPFVWLMQLLQRNVLAA